MGETRLSKENELREKERAERAERERKRKQKLQKISKAGDSSSSDENAIIPNKPESEMDSDLADSMLPSKKPDSKPKHQKKTKPAGPTGAINMEDSSSEEENKPKKATLPPKD